MIHRDIKPENILIIQKGNDWKAVITDYNVSTAPLKYDVVTEYAGTPGLIAPEILYGT